MLYEDALNTVIQNAIDAANNGDVLYGAILYENLRGDLDETVTRIIRTTIYEGEFGFQNESQNKFVRCKVMIQCYSKPINNQPNSFLLAEKDSFEMADKLVRILSANPTLGNSCLISYFNKFQKGLANVIGTDFGTTYLFGTINN